jgi:hypothetical protein
MKGMKVKSSVWHLQSDASQKFQQALVEILSRKLNNNN